MKAVFIIENVRKSIGGVQMKYDFLERLGIKKVNSGACFGEWIEKPEGNILQSINPATEEVIAEVRMAGSQDYEQVIEAAERAAVILRRMPAPKRGDIVRDLCNEFRRHKDDLGRLITMEVGKIYEEGKGEVQEIIDFSDVAIGHARMMGGRVTPSERPGHFTFESYDPLGLAEEITAFNFPQAVWGWNTLNATVCGDPVIWKPSLQAPLSAIAVQHICNRVMKKYSIEGVFNLLIGEDMIIGDRLVKDSRIPLVSFTGSTAVGLRVGSLVTARGGECILELGGNNALIILADANIDLAIKGLAFGFTGTAKQRCTSTSRAYPEEDIAGIVTDRVVDWCKSLTIGDPLHPQTQMGPLISEKARANVLRSVQKAKEQGGEVVYEGKPLDRKGFFLEPTVIYTKKHLSIMEKETFGPILYIQPIHDLEEGIALNNKVDQGLSSSLFTNNLLSAFHFLSAEGSDCGIRNVNCGTSGAEIGGAFGGNKHTGWGREAGGDAWKKYCRHSQCTINWSGELPLSQGIDFFKNKK
ncbi:MAG: aldehyde dehydrogenase family protein [bacterium]|nr:aldehyde dehydrogenase family protein [bacterium]